MSSAVRQLEGQTLFSPFRALDLTDDKGYLCGRILGDLGADVIKIERPGGDPGRSLGPFFHDDSRPGSSLYWEAYNANKRGITLDIETADGQQIFNRLVESADFVIESFPPGYMDSLGLGYSVLSQINPRIIMTSITPFGQTGPYRDLKSCDLVAMSMGGLVYGMGEPGKTPVRVSFPQACLYGSLEATVGTQVAHCYRERTGRGQYVDVSIQESLLLLLMTTLPHWDISQQIIKRSGSRTRWRTTLGGGPHVIYRCQDGYFLFQPFGGILGAPGNRKLVQWMDSEGMAPAFLKERDWEGFDYEKITQEELDQMTSAFGRFFLTHTKAELSEKFQREDIMGLPMSTVKDIAEDPQLQARDFWQQVDHTEFGTSVTYPGAPAQLTQAQIYIRRRAPLIGEHNGEIYGQELGLSKGEIVALKQAGVI